MKDLKKLAEILDKEIKNLALPEHPDSLYAPINYIMGLPAKRMRPLLVLIGYQLFDNDVERALSPAIAIELFHNFTLLHDDIMDNAPLRRGMPTVHKKWNNNTAILSGDVMMIQAYRFINQLESSCLFEVLNIFNNMAIKVCEGQQLDMDFEEKDDVSITDYIKMIEYKTAVLLAASLQIGSVVAQASQEDQQHLYHFGINIGLAFQLQDDLLDVFGSTKIFGKKIGGDILANKKTFLYLKSMQIADQQTKEKLKSYYINDKLPDKVNIVKEVFNRLAVKKHTIDMMKAYYVKAMKHLEAIDSIKKEPLISFTDKLMNRIY